MLPFSLTPVNVHIHFRVHLFGAVGGVFQLEDFPAISVQKWWEGRFRWGGSRTQQAGKSPSRSGAMASSRKPTNCLFCATPRLPWSSFRRREGFTSSRAPSKIHKLNIAPCKYSSTDAIWLMYSPACYYPNHGFLQQMAYIMHRIYLKSLTQLLFHYLYIIISPFLPGSYSMS